MITRPKNNYKKVYVVDKLCCDTDMKNCNVREIKHYPHMLIHNGRIVVAYCSCGCGLLQYAEFKGDGQKFNYQLNNGIKINPLEFVDSPVNYKF